jgi:peptidoglycan/xylan/chitin deacetylase (PgdA/CDA1 family)
MKQKKRLKRIITSIILIIIILTYLTYLIIADPENPKENSCLTLTFDDGILSHYTTVYPLLKEKDFSATFFIIANKTKFENKSLMNFDQIKELQNNGFEIGSHTITHPRLTKLEENQITKELFESKQILEQKGFEINSLSIPYRNYNKQILEQANQYYPTIRDNYNTKSGGFFFNSLSVDVETNIEKICKKIHTAKEKNYWLILIMHDINNNPERWDLSEENFKKVLACAKKAEIKVDSLSNCKSITQVPKSEKTMTKTIKKIIKGKKLGF